MVHAVHEQTAADREPVWLTRAPGGRWVLETRYGDPKTGGFGRRGDCDEGSRPSASKKEALLHAIERENACRNETLWTLLVTDLLARDDVGTSARVQDVRSRSSFSTRKLKKLNASEGAPICFREVAAC